MKITGTAALAASPQQVWDANHDPAVLARTLPGCESLTEAGEGEYRMRITAGVAAVRGTYDGVVQVLDVQPPNVLRMKASGSGAPGTIEADVDVRIDQSEDGGTLVTYAADAEVGGPIGGVGQRMLSGVTKKMAGQFFAALDAEIAGVPPEQRAYAPTPALTGAGVPAAAAAGASAPSLGEPSGIRPAGGVGTVYAGRAAATAGDTRIRDFAMGTLTGGAIALIGVLVGWAVGR